MSAGLQTLLVGLFGGLALVGIRVSLYFMSREDTPRAAPPQVQIPRPRAELPARSPENVG